MKSKSLLTRNISAAIGMKVDSILMRIVDVFSAIPWIIMVTVVSLLFKKGIASIIIVIGLFSWMGIARLVRSEVLSAKEREYVQYAKFIGVHPMTVIVKQWFFWFFFTIGIFLVAGGVGMIIAQNYT